MHELKEKLERKEFFMQSKEKKWLEVETILAEYIAEDDELRDKFQEMKLVIQGDVKMSSVVGENERLKKELGKAYTEIDRLREALLNPYSKKRHHGTNVYMRAKPKVKPPKPAFISVDLDEGFFKNGG